MLSPLILIQFDSDLQPSVFDAVVAIDSGVDHLLQYGQVEPQGVRDLVHGAMFTRGPDQLSATAIFIGGSDVSKGEAIAAEVQQTFFGPMRVSVMLDGNGSNTTAAAAVLCAARHIDLSTVDALVLGTGPVGQRVARLLVSAGANVRLGSRNASHAEQICQQLSRRSGDEQTGDGHTSHINRGRLSPVGTPELDQHLPQVNAVFGCAAAGVQVLNPTQLKQASQLKVAIDLNAVPPEGLAGIAATDNAVSRDGRIDYGAIGVGGLKMKIHRAAIRTLFTRNDLLLDAEEIFQIGRQLELERTI